MKKRIISIAASAALAASMLTSCMTINTGAALGEKGPIGQRVGEAKSTYILGLWSSKGEQNNIKQAAANGGITKVAQVEYIDKYILLGIVTKHTTRVYGE
ncbi:MAG: TRL-like family protein [Bacteroidaceae bacterium]|nr:TRL-like family protein [Bacteroidaceae bacterium]